MAYGSGFRALNVALRPESQALDAYMEAAGLSSEAIAAGFQPRPDWDLEFRGGKTISDLTYVCRYLGGADAWDPDDRTNIDAALEAIMSDPKLESIVAQYYDGPISSTALPSAFVERDIGSQFFKDDAEALVLDLLAEGVLGDADPGSSVICLMLPKDVVLFSGNSDGSDDEAEGLKPVLVEDEQLDSTHGLGGYHGGVHHHHGGHHGVVYYAVGVYSEGHNGIPAFHEAWKNVVATFYHELVEARTDPDVEDVNKTGDAGLLGWYSDKGGEIGDGPMKLAGFAHIHDVMKEVELAGGGTAPVQLEWSNRVHGPEGPEGQPPS